MTTIEQMTVDQAILASQQEDRTVRLEWSEETARTLSVECDDHCCDATETEDGESIDDYWGPDWRIELIHCKE